MPRQADLVVGVTRRPGILVVLGWCVAGRAAYVPSQLTHSATRREENERELNDGRRSHTSRLFYVYIGWLVAYTSQTATVAHPPSCLLDPTLVVAFVHTYTGKKWWQSPLPTRWTFTSAPVMVVFCRGDPLHPISYRSVCSSCCCSLCLFGCLACYTLAIGP